MRIYIPTRGRPELCTPRAIPEAYHKDIRLVVRPEERKLYEPTGLRLMVLPKSVNGLAATRQWILENAESMRFGMLDDDITSFCYKPELKKFGGVKKATDSNVIAMIEKFDEELLYGGAACVSSVDRMALARPSKNAFNEPSRAGQAMWINRAICMRKRYRFDRIQIYHDQDFALQIVRGRDRCLTSNRYGHNMRPLYAKGGLAAYRDQALIDRCAQELQDLHPGLVKVAWKEEYGLRVPRRSIKWKLAATSNNQD